MKPKSRIEEPRTGGARVRIAHPILVLAATIAIVQFAILSVEFAVAQDTGNTEQISDTNWARFRGPSGSGYSASNAPTQWTESDFNWTTKLRGIGHSSPVIWNDRIYVTSAHAETANQYVIAIDRETGAIIWERDFPIESYHIHGRNSYASNTPAVDADHVYLAWGTPGESQLMAIDHQGQTVWRKQLGGYDSSHGFGGSPIIYNDIVILCLLQRKPGERTAPAAPTSHVVACNRLTGELVWSTLRMSEVASYATPFILKRPGLEDELIGCSTAHGIFSLDPKSGNENWSLEVFDKRTVSSPVYAGGLLFGTTGSGGGGNYVAAIQPGPNPTLAYEVRKQAPYVPSVVAKDNLVFLWSDKGVVTCIDARSGDAHWTKRVGGEFSGSPIVAGGAVYCIDEAGTVVVLAAKTEYELLSKFELGEPSRSTPAASDGEIYFRTESKLFSLGSR